MIQKESFNMRQALITARNLYKKFGDLVAVDHIDFDIDEGETYGFLGPNGAGKTTTMKMIYCFVLPDGGSLTVDGLDVLRHPRKIKQKLGVVHQEDSLDPDLTVKKNLITYARYFGLFGKSVSDRADELIDMMSLSDKKNTVIEELSGGMKRRLMIIRGLINDPKILILDEPTTGLDPQARHLVWQKLRALKKSGITILLTTHYMEEAEQLCDRLAIMNDGRIIASGSPAELIGRFAAPEVIELLEPEPEVIARLPAIIDGKGTFERHEDVLYIYGGDLSAIVPALRKFKTRAVLERKGNLEDVFLRLAGRAFRE